MGTVLSAKRLLNGAVTSDGGGKTVCPVCAGPCAPLGAVDFNTSCEDARGKLFEPAGIAVHYVQCGECGFSFAPEFLTWSPADFGQKIYNHDYALVDPDHAAARPEANAAVLRDMFAPTAGSFRHLDYGGGNGHLARCLRDAGWNSASYDPFFDRQLNAQTLGRFDLITAYEVFEHVPDVRRLMADLRALLAPGGLVLFSTLLSDGQLEPSAPISWWYAAPRNGHISLFSRRSLTMLAGASGLKFDSFSDGMHIFFTQVPPWAAHLVAPAPAF